MQKTFQHTVVDCPNCHREYICPIEQEFIMDMGICLGCEKRYCEVQEDLAYDYSNQLDYV